MDIHRGFQLPDLLVQRDQHCCGGVDGGGVGGGDRGGLGQLRDAQRVLDRLGPGGRVAPAGTPERGADLGSPDPPPPPAMLADQYSRTDSGMLSSTVS